MSKQAAFNKENHSPEPKASSLQPTSDQKQRRLLSSGKRAHSLGLCYKISPFQNDEVRRISFGTPKKEQKRAQSFSTTNFDRLNRQNQLWQALLSEDVISDSGTLVPYNSVNLLLLDLLQQESDLAEF